uniref:hypothetical protein n=1 Tax=Sphingomonas sp. TaxID=28214 RepID=UPI0025DAF3C8
VALGSSFATHQISDVVAALLYGEQTSARIASIASRGMNDPSSLTLDEIKCVCASALTQTADKA